MADAKRLAHLYKVKSTGDAQQLGSIKIEMDFLARASAATTMISLQRGIDMARG
ncbi:hypothetical protein JQ625_02525 [Bradyrhizobium diazoefficiens]|nr:hypothetical protein [Bradyrhizobium diazoefficiens]MBR0773697.1 hypothetical protein [Bradyrhizobium diazoefficiens]